MKSKSYILGISLLSVLALFSCKKENELAFSTNPLKAGQTEYDRIYVGDTKQVKVESYGVKSSDGYAVSGVSWSSSDNFVATVNSNGLVTARKVGKANIIGKFDGKTVYCTIEVSGRAKTYFEPVIKESITDITNKELVAGKKVMRSNIAGAVPYAVFKDTTTVGGTSENTDYTVYLFAENATSAMVNLITEKAVKEVAEVFLPERYNLQEGYYNNPYKVRVMQSSSPFKDVVFYTNDSYPMEITDFATQYRLVSKEYVLLIVNPATYGKDVLGLENDFTYESRDKGAIDNIASECNTTIDNQGSTIKSIEDKLASATTDIYQLFLAGARLEAQDMCHSKLPAEPTIENFYQPALDSIQKLDNNFMARYDTASTIVYLDRLVTSAQKSYSGFLTKEVIDKNVIKSIDNEYQTYVKKQADYSEAAFALIEAHYASAKAEAEYIFSLKDANDIMAKQKALDKDVIKSADEESQKNKLDTEFAKYNESEYTEENWATLKGIYEKAKADLEAGQLYYSVVSTAIEEMAKVEKKQ